MGYYEGQRPSPCPRCGGVVSTLFISVGPMSFSERCGGCGTTEFTKAEQAQLAVEPVHMVLSPMTAEDDGSTAPVDAPDRFVDTPEDFDG